MKLSKILSYFTPKERKFYGMFNQTAEYIVSASVEFKKLINAPDEDERKVYGVNIKSLEKKGDDITNKIFDELHQTFITPFDREDIQALASALDDVLDLIYSVAGKIEYYRCTVISSYMKEMAEKIHEGCLQVQIAVGGLDKMHKDNKIKNACKELNKIESRVDDFFHHAISSLFENEKDPIELIRQKEILTNIEKIANKIEDVSDVIRTILVKYA